MANFKQLTRDAAYEFSSRNFNDGEEPKEVVIFTQEDVENFIVAPLAYNRCIKVTIEYSDIPDQTLEEMCNSVTDENRQELIDFGKSVGKEII